MIESEATTGEMWRIADTAAGWIFPVQTADAVNQFVDFLHRFECEVAAPAAEVWISADTDFIVWLNGQRLGQGQYSNFPDRKTYERFPLGEALRKGLNTLAVTVFYNGRNSSVYRRGDPGLLFEVRADRVLATSGTNTLCRCNPCYHSGPIAIVSGQLAYTFGYDARGDDRFHHDAYVPGDDWTAVAEAEVTRPDARALLMPRPVPRLEYGDLTQATLVASGRFRVDVARAESESGATAAEQTAAGLVLSEGPPVSPARQMQQAELSAASPQQIADVPEGSVLGKRPEGLRVQVADLDGNDGVYLMFDLGREEVGHLELEIEASAGTIVDVGYGEHLDDGRVRTFVGRRNFAGRYICCEGCQRFTHRFLRWAGRYLQIQVHSGVFTLHGLALRRCDYPVEQRAEMETGHALHGRLLDVGCRTLRLCMHEHYEDTPWREQALYANDARTQALCGYYAFGESAMPAASFTLLGQGLRDDGFLHLTAPAAPPLTIPSFTFAWMLAVRDHFLYSGDDALARAFLPQMLSMLRAFLDERRDGLLPLRQGNGIWHFYDWSAGMSGYADEDFAQGLDADAPLNCFLILALDAVLQVCDWCGEAGAEDLAAAATELRRRVAERFWDAGEDAFRTHAQAQTLTELTQALAVLAGVGDVGMRERALERMARRDSGLAGPGLSQSFYTFEALMSRKKRFGAGVLAGIEATWGKMLDAGATTFWETIIGASDFGNAGSLCHGWSAVPVYVLYHDVLGVRPLEPGFRTFSADPLTAVAKHGSGRVPIPGGEIRVSWMQADGQTQVSVESPDHVQRAEGTSAG
jgi:alpha-L-rhamnosidase